MTEVLWMTGAGERNQRGVTPEHRQARRAPIGVEASGVYAPIAEFHCDRPIIVTEAAAQHIAHTLLSEPGGAASYVSVVLPDYELGVGPLTGDDL